MNQRNHGQKNFSRFPSSFNTKEERTRIILMILVCAPKQTHDFKKFNFKSRFMFDIRNCKVEHFSRINPHQILSTLSLIVYVLVFVSSFCSSDFFSFSFFYQRRRKLSLVKINFCYLQGGIFH